MSDDSSERSSSQDGGAGSPSRLVSMSFAAAVILILLGAALGARFRGARVARVAGRVHLTEPAVGFDKFPREFLGYDWQDEVLDANTERVLGAMYYLKLNGFRPRDASVTSLLVTYFGESFTMVEHEPEVCMDAGGWTLPYGIGKTKLPIPATAGRPAWNLPVNVYLFQKDVERVLLVNTYCINGEYVSDRDAAKMLGERGKGFYAQTRVTIPLSDFEWVSLRVAAGSQDNVYGLAKDASRVEREVRKLESMREATDGPEGDKAHPYIRIAEIMRYVIPKLAEHLPAQQREGGAESGGG